MKVILAPDSYKGSLSAIGVCRALESGLRRADPNAEILQIPMADGGEGTVEALLLATGGQMRHLEVTGPMGTPAQAFWGLLPDGSCVIEMAAAAGLPQVAYDKRDPRVTTTYGVGELIRDALDHGCRKFIIGIGGSATNDGGIGMLQALGAQFSDAQGQSLPHGGAALQALHRIDVSGLDPRIAGCDIRVACDVNNPLCGPNGASAIFGPQKGATPEIVEQLDRALAHYAQCVKRQLKLELAGQSGAGAAGGLGYGMIVFLKATLQPGVEIMLEAAGMDTLLADADLVITGEGQTDAQTAFGKVPAGVGQIAKKHHVPVVCLSGALGHGYEVVYDLGVTACFSIANRPMPLHESIERTENLLTAAAYDIGRLVQSML